MSDIQVTAVLTVHPGKLEEFQSAAQDCVQSVRENDTGTLQYDWFFNDDRTVCYVRERYESSEAVLQHIQNLGDKLPALLETSDILVQIFGAPSQELLDATSGIPTEVYAPFAAL